MLLFFCKHESSQPVERVDHPLMETGFFYFKLVFCLSCALAISRCMCRRNTDPCHLLECPSSENGSFDDCDRNLSRFPWPHPCRPPRLLGTEGLERHDGPPPSGGATREGGVLPPIGARMGVPYSRPRCGRCLRLSPPGLPLLARSGNPTLFINVYW